jgi:hypothetical protein
MVDRDMERNGQNISSIVLSVSGLSLDILIWPSSRQLSNPALISGSMSLTVAAVQMALPVLAK